MYTFIYFTLLVFKLWQKLVSRFWTEYFGETLLRPQWMVAELQPTEPLPELAVGSVLKLGVYRSESYIFESSCPPPVPLEGDQG